MAIITLTSDFGHKDYFTSAIKGAILSEVPEAKIVDISHEISPFNIQEAAYILKNAYAHFPKGSIHMIGVDTEITKNKVHVALIVDGHYFIGADTGIFSLIFPEDKLEQIIVLNINQDKENISFPMKDVFVQAACHINRGGTLGVIGRQIDSLREVKNFQPTISADGKMLIGQVIYIDHYGNVISNIKEKLFRESTLGKSFTIQLPRRYSVETIHRSYSMVPEGVMLCLFNSAGHLEISINKGDANISNGASELLGIKVKDRIGIEII
jgi:hypothetical protein